MMKVFEYGQGIKTRWNNIKPRSVEEEIKEIDLKTDKWNQKEISDIYRDMFNNYFNDNIKRKSYKMFAKEWHKNVKMISNYSKNNGILDL